jgi:cytochrome d ubiquinol oxidase subunit II
MFDYVTLKIIWWAIMCFVMIAFAVTGGMDIGVNFLLPIIGKSEDQRRLVINSIGPTWEGNQVWLITLGAGLFAIWPNAYATAFSGLYFAFLLVVIMLILRPPGFDYRGKIESQIWRRVWDTLIFLSSLVLAIVFGVAIGNLFIGLPFYYDHDLHSLYSGGFFNLLNPIAIIFGLVSLCMCAVQGALFLQYKLEGELAQRAQANVKIFGLGFMVSFIGAGACVCLYVNGYVIKSIPDLNTGFAATQKVVAYVNGWLNNYTLYPALWALPIFTIIATKVAITLSHYGKPLIALFINSVAIVCTVLTAATALFPFILPSSANPNHSLTIWDACSSHLTLEWGLIAVIILVPFILLYTTWVYRVMRGKVTLQHESY